LQTLGGLAALSAAPTLWAQPVQAKGQGRLIVVFLRGAYDGLSVFVPYADPQYTQLRQQIAIAAPDGTDKTALRLDDVFALHPALAPLLPLWQQGVLSFVPAAGSPDPTRSHFEAQHHWEIGIPGKNNDAPGWLNTLAGLQGTGSAAAAIGVGEANPQILAGAAAVKLIPKGQAATRSGVLGNERTRQAVMNLYAGSDKVSQAFREGADSRMQTAQTLSAENIKSEMMAADNGAASAAGLALDAQHLGTLMRQDRRLRLGFLSAGGWDTHANQGNVSGALATNLAGLGKALVQLRRDFSEPGDVIVVMSEFGRTSAENGTRGTDHGHGNALWLLGDKVQGGRWHGQWAGLARGNLHEGRDLPVLHDFRGVLAQVLRRSFNLTDSQLANVFPGGKWDASLDGLMRA
jgi:uncharacterized protein (DUF1501 family)